MAATDHLHPVQFRQDKTDREDKDEGDDTAGSYQAGNYGDTDLLDYQYERIGRATTDVDPKTERKAMKL